MLTLTVRRVDSRVTSAVPRNLPFGDRRKIPHWPLVHSVPSHFSEPPCLSHILSAGYSPHAEVSACRALVLFSKDCSENLPGEAVPQ